jgi:hypothetical protein
MRRMISICVVAASLAAVPASSAGTAPSYSVCTPPVVDPAPYTGQCSATTPGGRKCTSYYVNGQQVDYRCTNRKG